MLEDELRKLDQVLDIHSVPLVYWLLSVAGTFFIMTLISELASSGENRSIVEAAVGLGSHQLVIATSLATLAMYVYSYINGYYYSIYVVICNITQLFSLLLVSSASSKGDVSENKRSVELALHINAITLIFAISARWLIRGVNAEETSSDTLNIYYYGGYRYSMHTGWCDLAPVDSLPKVMNLHVGGLTDPYSSYENFLFSFLSGLLLYLLLYSYLKKRNLWHVTPLLAPALAIHPYSVLSNLHVTPVNITLSLAMASVVVLMRSTDKASPSLYLTAGVLYGTSVLSHPFSLNTLLLLLAFIIARFIDGSLGKASY